MPGYTGIIYKEKNAISVTISKFVFRKYSEYQFTDELLILKKAFTAPLELDIRLPVLFTFTGFPPAEAEINSEICHKGNLLPTNRKGPSIPSPLPRHIATNTTGVRCLVNNGDKRNILVPGSVFESRF
jgi:hypothetical protein